MNALLVISLAAAACSLASAQSSDCLLCICDTATGCDTTVGCNELSPPSCGAYQINFGYWCDGNDRTGVNCDATNPTHIAEWQSCANDFACATTTVAGYMDTYQSCHGVSPTCEDYAQLHRGGPTDGCPPVVLADVINFGQTTANCCQTGSGTPNC